MNIHNSKKTVDASTHKNLDLTVSIQSLGTTGFW